MPVPLPAGAGYSVPVSKSAIPRVLLRRARLRHTRADATTIADATAIPPMNPTIAVQGT